MDQTSRVTVKLDGESLRSKPGASIKIGGETRTGFMTDQGDLITQEKLEPCEINAVMPHLADTDLPALRALKGFTAIYETDTGVVYTVANAAVAEVGELKDGDVPIKIIGKPAK